MQTDNHSDNQSGAQNNGFWATLLQGLIRDMVGFLITFLIGTAVGAVLCLYFGVPLIFALLGGVLVLAVYVAWDRF